MNLDRELYAKEASQEFINMEEMYRTVLLDLYTSDCPGSGSIAIVDAKMKENIQTIIATPYAQLRNGGWASIIHLSQAAERVLARVERLIEEMGTFITIETTAHVQRLRQTILRVAASNSEEISMICAIFDQAVSQALARRGIRFPRVALAMEIGEIELQLLKEREEIAKRLLILCGIASSADPH